MRTRHLDHDELKNYSPEPWQLAAIDANPGYVSWGVGEDYMPSPKTDGGWSSSQSYAAWGDFGPWGLDALNECANFYFFLERDSKDCEVCHGSGLNPETERIANSFYNHQSPTGKGWHDQITQDEVQALLDAGRLHDLAKTFIPGKGWQPREDEHIPTADEVNAWESGPGMGHDAINRWILIEARAKRLGVYGHCPHCDQGTVYTSNETKLGLMLWMLHPRKGCSRGVEVLEITESEIQQVYAWLREAADRNAKRFTIPA